MCAHNPEIFQQLQYVNGACKVCDKERAARYNKRKRDGMAIIHAAEDKGLTARQALDIIANTPPELLRRMVNADLVTIDQIQAVHDKLAAAE